MEREGSKEYWWKAKVQVTKAAFKGLSYYDSLRGQYKRRPGAPDLTLTPASPTARESFEL